jgi:hypothetical protein
MGKVLAGIDEDVNCWFGGLKGLGRDELHLALSVGQTERCRPWQSLLQGQAAGGPAALPARLQALPGQESPSCDAGR